MPTYLGGSGKFTNALQDLPFAKYDKALPTYALLTFGFRIYSCLKSTFLVERGKEFMEMFFHDIVTIFLFYDYIFGYMMPIGTLVVIIHDITDVPIHISKGMYATKLSD